MFTSALWLHSLEGLLHSGCAEDFFLVQGHNDVGIPPVAQLMGRREVLSLTWGEQ